MSIEIYEEPGINSLLEYCKDYDWLEQKTAGELADIYDQITDSILDDIAKLNELNARKRAREREKHSTS